MYSNVMYACISTHAPAESEIDQKGIEMTRIDWVNLGKGERIQ